MAYDRFLIAPYQNGLRKDLISWLSPQDSFQRFDNVNVFRGKIKKRFGGKLVGGDKHTSRVRIQLARANIDTTDGTGGATGNLPAGFHISLGQRFYIGTDTYTVTVFGVPAVLTKDGGAATTHTLNTTTGAYVFVGAAATESVYWYADGNSGEIITDAATGAATGYAPGTIYKVGQTFLIDTEVFTVKESGTMLRSIGAGVCTFDTTTGAFVFVNAPKDKAIIFYPTEPIMKITHYELGPVNEHTTYVTDTQFVYKFDGTYWSKDTTFPSILKGDNKQFFWSANYVGATAGQIGLFLTNFNATIGGPSADDDPMYSYNGTLWEDFSAYTKFNGDEDIIQSAKMLIAWKNRLFAINIIEKDITGPTNTAYVNRIRYSHSGSPFSGSAWLERRQAYGAFKGDGGGYRDLPVEQEIVSAAVVKDRLIIYCERSTWELAYTGNEGNPFIWRNLDTNIGSESPYSTVGFDNEIVTISTTGIYSCNGSDVIRIDKQIPDEVFGFLKTAEGTMRVHGIRDYYNGLAYWTVLEFGAETSHTFPNKLLVFNYENSSWSFYDDTITTFGYFEQSTDKTWADPGVWDTTDTWGGYYEQGNSRFILAGNHQGFLFIIDNKYPQNAPVMTIANLEYVADVATVTLPKHNLTDGEFIKLIDSNVTGTIDNIYKIIYSSEDAFKLNGLDGVYKGDGTIQRVSKINMTSNDWNPYIKTGEDIMLAKIDFCVKNTQDCNMTVTYDVDTLRWDFVDKGIASGANLGTNVLQLYAYDGITIEQFKEILWRTIYFQATGSFVNITISMTDEQMLIANNSLSPFELQGMILYTMKVGR